MRTVDVATLTQNIKEMCIEANHFLSEDMKTAFTKAEQQEKAPLGKQILQQLQQNMDIAGRDIANPIATILSASMMLRYSFDLDKEADAVDAAVKAVLQEGLRTGDIMSEGCRQIGCTEMGDVIASHIAKNA